jgi:phosphatidate cytidylyltransferase
MLDPLILKLFAYVLGALVVATLGGLILRVRYGPTGAITNFQSRTNAWWVMVGILAVAMVAGKTVTVALYAVLSAAALYEFLVLEPDRRLNRVVVATAFFVAIPAQYWLVWIEWYGLFAIFVPVWVFLFVAILSVLSTRPEGFLARVAELQWGLMLAVYSLSHVPALLFLNIPGFEGRNILLLAFLVLVVQFSDVSQYLWGKAIGRHKLAPAVSPGKTVEGLLGGIATACVVGVFFSWITPFTRVEAALMSLLIAGLGFFGGFVLSAIKRDRGVKDWGAIIPGHGGILDRIDSLLFAAPIYFHVLRYWWAV